MDDLIGGIKITVKTKEEELKCYVVKVSSKCSNYISGIKN
jgi:hypothetical protein